MLVDHDAIRPADGEAPGPTAWRLLDLGFAVLMNLNPGDYTSLVPGVRVPRNGGFLDRPEAAMLHELLLLYSIVVAGLENLPELASERDPATLRRLHHELRWIHDRLASLQLPISLQELREPPFCALADFCDDVAGELGEEPRYGLAPVRPARLASLDLFRMQRGVADDRGLILRRWRPWRSKCITLQEPAEISDSLGCR